MWGQGMVHGHCSQNFMVLDQLCPSEAARLLGKKFTIPGEWSADASPPVSIPEPAQRCNGLARSVSVPLISLLLVGSAHPGRLYTSLAAPGNTSFWRPREKALCYPERLFNNSSSQFFPKIPTPVLKMEGYIILQLASPSSLLAEMP